MSSHHRLNRQNRTPDDTTATYAAFPDDNTSAARPRRSKALRAALVLVALLVVYVVVMSVIWWVKYGSVDTPAAAPASVSQSAAPRAAYTPHTRPSVTSAVSDPQLSTPTVTPNEPAPEEEKVLADAVSGHVPDVTYPPLPPEVGTGNAGTFRMEDTDGCVVPRTVSVSGAGAPVRAEDLTNGGALLPPKNVGELAWYKHSACIGQSGRGSTVITGHINDVSQGAGFASRFVHLVNGQEVSVDTDKGARRYKVVEPPREYNKTTGLPSVVNDSTGDEKLVLVTCGGEFVGGALGYDSNIVTVLEPIK